MFYDGVPPSLDHQVPVLSDNWLDVYECVQRQMSWYT